MFIIIIIITLLSLSVSNHHKVELTMQRVYKTLGQNAGLSFPHKNKDQCSHQYTHSNFRFCLYSPANSPELSPSDFYT